MYGKEDFVCQDLNTLGRACGLPTNHMCIHSIVHLELSL